MQVLGLFEVFASGTNKAPVVLKSLLWLILMVCYGVKRCQALLELQSFMT